MSDPLGSLNRLIKKVARDQRGVIIVMFALLMPIMLGFIGLGVEVGYWFGKSRDLQAAADAAALAGAYEVYYNRSSQTKTIADREAGNNGWDSTTGTSTVSNSQYNGTTPTGTYTTSYAADTAAVEVILTQTIDRMFSGWFMNNDLTLTAVAVATQSAGTATTCVLALGASNPSDAVKVTGSANITMSGCSITTNSTDAEAFRVTGSSTLSVDCAYSAGGSDISATLTTTECSGIQENAIAAIDPYADSVTEPVDSDFDNCGSDGSNGDGNNYDDPSPPADDTINPGVYCDINYNNNNKTLTMNAGNYYIDRGDFELQSNSATLDASAGVTVILGDSTGGGNCGDVKITGAATLNITAPTTGNFAGIVFYRGPSCDASTSVELKGGSSSDITGAIYMPTALLKYSGNSTLTGNCVQMIVDQVEFSGSGTIGTSCAGTGVQTITSGSVVSLVE